MADDDEEQNNDLGSESMKQSSSLQQMLDSISKERSKPTFSVGGNTLNVVVCITCQKSNVFHEFHPHIFFFLI